MKLLRCICSVLFILRCAVSNVKLKHGGDTKPRQQKRYAVYEPFDNQVTLANKIIAEEEAKERQHVLDALSIDPIYTGEEKEKSVDDVNESKVDSIHDKSSTDNMIKENSKFQNPVTRDHLKTHVGTKKMKSEKSLESLGFEEDKNEDTKKKAIGSHTVPGHRRNQEYPEFNIHHVGAGPFADTEGNFHVDSDSREGALDGDEKNGMEEELRDQDDESSDKHHQHALKQHHDGRPQPHHHVGLRPTINDEGSRRTMHGQIDDLYTIPGGNVQRGIQPDQTVHMTDVKHIDRLQHEVDFQHKLIGDHDESDDEYSIHHGNRYHGHHEGNAGMRDGEHDDDDEDDIEGGDSDDDDEENEDNDDSDDDDVETYQDNRHAPIVSDTDGRRSSMDDNTGNFERGRVQEGDAVQKQTIPDKHQKLVSENIDEEKEKKKISEMKEKFSEEARNDSEGSTEKEDTSTDAETKQSEDDDTSNKGGTKIAEYEETKVSESEPSEELLNEIKEEAAKQQTVHDTIESQAMKESADEENEILKKEQLHGSSVITGNKNTISLLDSDDHEANLDVPGEAIADGEHQGLESFENGDHIAPGRHSYHIYHEAHHKIKPINDYSSAETHVYNQYSNPCENGGLFVPISRIKHVCICPKKYMGKSCADENYCYNRPCRHCGRCMVTRQWPHYKCECCRKYSGKNCEIRNPCEPNPCVNDGVCTHDGHAPSCICKEKFKGAYCEEVNKCLPNPCLNDAVCVEKPGVGSFQCICKQGWLGTICGVPSQCANEPCKNGGTCQEEGRKFKCICMDGYVGVNCERKLCYPNPCGNGGTCVEDGRNFHCMCPGWSKGETCTDISPCLMNPCLNGARCVDAFSGFRWTLGTMQYYCICQPPFHGPHCETNPCLYCDLHAHCEVTSCVCDDGYVGDGITCHKVPLPCHPNPCLNAGTCVDEGHGFYHCHCKPPYQPPFCELPTYCHPNPCHGGTCIALKDGFKCIDCPEGYSGKTCGVTDLCKPNPCQHGGKCKHTSETTFGCICDHEKDYIGDLCEKCSCSHSIDPLVPSSYCDSITGKCTCPLEYTINLRSGLCQKTNTSTSRACTPNPCNCGGSCTPDPQNPTDALSFKCTCPKECYGDKCQFRHICFQFNPCANGGTCIDLGGKNYRCNCKTGYSGENCTTIPPVIPPVNPCVPNPCHNGGVCIKVAGSYDCKCLSRFTGPTCSIDKCKDCDEHAKCFAGECICHHGYIGNGYSCIKECGGKCLDIEICSGGVCDCMGGYHRVHKVCTRLRDPADYYTHPTQHPRTSKHHTKNTTHGYPTPIPPKLPVSHAFVTHFTKPTVKTSATKKKEYGQRPTAVTTVKHTSQGQPATPSIPLHPVSPVAPTTPKSANTETGSPVEQDSKKNSKTVKKEKLPGTVDYKLMIVSDDGDDITGNVKPLVVNKEDVALRTGDKRTNQPRPAASLAESAVKKQDIHPTVPINIFWNHQPEKHVIGASFQENTAVSKTPNLTHNDTNEIHPHITNQTLTKFLQNATKIHRNTTDQTLTKFLQNATKIHRNTTVPMETLKTNMVHSENVSILRKADNHAPVNKKTEYRRKAKNTTLEGEKNTTLERKENTTFKRKENTTLERKENTTLERKENTTLERKENTTLERKENTTFKRKESATFERKEKIQHLFRNATYFHHPKTETQKRNKTVKKNSLTSKKNTTRGNAKVAKFDSKTENAKKRSNTKDRNDDIKSRDFHDIVTLHDDEEKDDEGDARRGRIIDVLKEYGENLDDEIIELSDDTGDMKEPPKNDSSTE